MTIKKWTISEQLPIFSGQFTTRWSSARSWRCSTCCCGCCPAGSSTSTGGTGGVIILSYDHMIITSSLRQARHPPAPDRDHGHQQERHQERGGQRAQRLRAHPLPRYGVQGHHNAAVQTTGSSIIILLYVQARPSCRPYLPATPSTTEDLPGSYLLLNISTNGAIF